MLEYRSSFPDRLTDPTLHHRERISSRVHPVSYLIHTTDKADHCVRIVLRLAWREGCLHSPYVFTDDTWV